MKEKEREKIHTSEEEKRTLVAREPEVSLDRADNVIEGGPAFALIHIDASRNGMIPLR